MGELDRKLWPLVEMIEKVRVLQLRRFRTSGPILGTEQLARLMKERLSSKLLHRLHEYQ
jgi:hypothetical protein